MLRAVEKLNDEPPGEEGGSAPSRLRDAPIPREEETTSEEAAFQDILQEVTRGQTRALMIEYLASRLVSDFAAQGGEKPKMLLRLPNTGSFAADVHDVLELNNELLTMAGQARARVRQLLRSRVSVPTEPPRGGTFSPPTNPSEAVVESASLGPKRRRVHDEDWSELEIVAPLDPQH